MSPWTKEQAKVFISLLKQHPCLFDRSNLFYGNKTRRKTAINQIIDGMWELRPDITEKCVTTKIKTLRSQFMREKAKMLAMKRSGAGDTFRPTLWCFEELSFLMQLNDHVESTCNFKPEIEANEDSYGSYAGSVQSTEFVGEILEEMEESSNSIKRIKYDSEQEDTKFSVKQKTAHDLQLKSAEMVRLAENQQKLQNEQIAILKRIESKLDRNYLTPSTSVDRFLQNARKDLIGFSQEDCDETLEELQAVLDRKKRKISINYF